MAYSPQGKKFNPRERSIQEEHLQRGWKTLYKGWPDSLFYKEDGNKIQAFFMEVKRPPLPNGKVVKNTYDRRLSPEQLEMHRVLRKLGLDVKIIFKE